MVSVKIKKIKGKRYLYAEYSFRVDGKIKKISKLIKNKEDARRKEVSAYFREKELDAYKKLAIARYKKDDVLDERKIVKIESYRVEYKEILRKLTKKQISDVLDRFTVNFTYESNAIEGNSLTLKDVTLFLSENMMPKGKDLREIYETRNTRIANALLFRGKIKISLKDIVKIHAVLMKDTGVSLSFKKMPNFLLMRNVETTPPEMVYVEMKRLVEWYNSAKGKMHPLKIAAIFHGKFEKIHPFEDGNGRVGRVLANAILIDNNYPPLIIRKTSRQAYFSALESFDGGHAPKLERFLVEKFEQTFEKFFKVYVKYL